MKSHISNSLFLDLAFIIIAALVLLVKDPQLVLVKEDIEEKITVKALPVEQSNSEVYEDTALLGESLWLRISNEGALVLLSDDETDEIQLRTLPERLEGMAQEGERVVVMKMDEGTDYQTFVSWRNRLLEFKKQGVINGIHEHE